MEKESFIDAYLDMPEDLSGIDSRLYVFRGEDFGAWYRRLRIAHEREVDGGVAGMTDAQLADHGLCRIGSAAMWDELRDMKDRELSEEHGLVRLPVDADGVPIHVGDILDGYGETTVVKRLTLRDDGWSMTCENGLWFCFDAFTHHHEPTVEDVLREFGKGWYEQMSGPETFDIADYVERYAAKLQLREDK